LKSNAESLSNLATKLVTSALGISELTVKVIMAVYNKKGKEGLDWSRSFNNFKRYNIKDGWVPNSKLVFKASKKTGDYHTNMNWGNFSRWFQEKLLKNIPKNSIIQNSIVSSQ